MSTHVLALNEKALSFSHTILETTMDLFPGSPIHVGGDECPGTGWLTDPASRRLLERAGVRDRAGAQA